MLTPMEFMQMKQQQKKTGKVFDLIYGILCTQPIHLLDGMFTKEVI